MLAPKDDSVVLQYLKQAGSVLPSLLTSATVRKGRPLGSTDGGRRDKVKSREKQRKLKPAPAQQAAAAIDNSIVPYNPTGSKRPISSTLMKGAKALKGGPKATPSSQEDDGYFESSTPRIISQKAQPELSKVQCELAVEKATSAMKDIFQEKIDALKDESFLRQMKEADRRVASAEASTVAAAAGAQVSRAQDAERFERQEVRSQQFALDLIRTVAPSSQDKKSASRGISEVQMSNSPGSRNEVDAATQMVDRIKLAQQEAARFRALAEDNKDNQPIYATLSLKAKKKEDEAQELLVALAN